MQINLHKIAEKDEEAELSLLVAEVIKSGYNPGEMNEQHSLVEISFEHSEIRSREHRTQLCGTSQSTRPEGAAGRDRGGSEKITPRCHAEQQTKKTGIRCRDYGTKRADKKEARRTSVRRALVENQPNLADG